MIYTHLPMSTALGLVCTYQAMHLCMYYNYQLCPRPSIVKNFIKLSSALTTLLLGGEEETDHTIPQDKINDPIEISY